MTIQPIVDILYNAYSDKQAISKNQVVDTINKSTAYKVQHYLTNKKAENDNDPLVGYKISLTSEETQKMFNSETPLYGALTESNIVESMLKLDQMLSPLVEMELVFIVMEELTTADDIETILSKTRIAPALEIPDSRFTNWFPHLSLGQVVADSAVAGKVVVGEPIDGCTVNQLENIKGTLTLNGEVIASGNSSEVLGNPVHAVKWLIEELAQNGQQLKVGSIISSGTFILPKVLEKGIYEAEYKGIGNVSLRVI